MQNIQQSNPDILVTLSLYVLAKQMTVAEQFGEHATIGDYAWREVQVGAACLHGDHEDPQCGHSGCGCACHG